jgi:hypothetical protein
MRTTELFFVCARGSFCEHACILSVRAEGFALQGPESLFHNLLGLSIRRIQEMGTVRQVRRNRLCGTCRRENKS